MGCSIVLHKMSVSFVFSMSLLISDGILLRLGFGVNYIEGLGSG